MDYLTVWTRDGESTHCEPDDEPRLDAVVTAFLDSGRTKDTLLCLTMLEGVPYKVLASEVTSWAVSTADSRKMRVRINHESEEEERSAKAELGIFE